MKKFLALILALLTTTLIFTSCDTDGGEEESSSFAPATEVSSTTEVSSEPISEPASEEDPTVVMPVAVSEKDLEYHAKYMIALLSVGNYSWESELLPGNILRSFAFMISDEKGIYAKTFNPISKTDAWYEKQTYSLEELDRVLKTYLGDRPFAEALKKNLGEMAESVTYNAEDNTIEMVGAHFGTGGLEGANRCILPTKQEGNRITIYYPNANLQGTEIVGGTVVVVEEFDGGFHYVRVSELTEDEIAHLNEKYFDKA